MNQLSSFPITPIAAALLALPLQCAWARYDLLALEKVEQQVHTVAEKNMPSVVALMATTAEHNKAYAGSGVVISKNGLIVTAAHVVANSDMVNVIFTDGKQVQAKVLGVNSSRDIAMALITEPGTYPCAELGDTKDLAVGEMVVAMGHPGGFDPLRNPPVRFGRVFSFDHDKFIRSDCALAGGDSGGPLFDLEGKVIGIHSSVSFNMSENDDAPVEAVRKDWDRLIMGERWGQSRSKSELSKLSSEELSGLNMEKFKERVIAEAMKNNGKLSASPDAIGQWLKDCGMKEEKIQSLDPAAKLDLVVKASGGTGKLQAVPQMESDALSEVPAEEMAGLNAEKFKERVMAEAMKANGRISATPEAIGQWLMDCGMKEEKVKSLDPAAKLDLVVKASGGTGKIQAAPGINGDALAKLPEEQLAGLNAAKFKERVIAEAMKNNGDLALDQETIAQWLKDCGMKEEKIKSLDGMARVDLVKKAVGNAGVTEAVPMVSDKAAQAPPAKESATKSPEEDLTGLDIEKFQQRLMDQAMKNNGGMKTTPEEIAKWLGECGMSEEQLKKLGPDQLMKVLQKAAGSAPNGKVDSNPALNEQDKEMMQTVKPALDKLSPSVVSLMDGGKTLALGTIIRSNGFILTKHSEIAKAKGVLKARLADGREFTGVEVRQFSDHDLALVKIPADSLPAVSFAELREPLEPGNLLFTPGGRSTGSMLAMGVVSVKDRALEEGGGYLGIGLAQGKEGVEVGEVAPDSPAAKAGLMTKDLILAVDDKPVGKMLELSSLIRSFAADTKILINYRRGGEEKTAEVTLGDRIKRGSQMAKVDPMSTIGTKVSDQATGFPLVFQHDQPLKPEECGGIIADLHGQVVGVNIARAGRVNSYAIPAGTVAGLLKTVDFETLGK